MENERRKRHRGRRAAPSDGERRAMIGYGAQYQLAAVIILRHLRQNLLEFVILGAESAGQVDDLVIGSRARLDAYQVKWRRYARPFTFARLTTAQGDSPTSLIAQLADGWQHLQAMH